jgi:hypothetical protein
MWLLVPLALVSALASVFLMALVHALPDPHLTAVCALVIALSVLIGAAAL